MRRVLVVSLVFGVLFLAQTLRADSIFTATLDGAQEPTASTATGFGMVILNTAQTMITVDENWTGLIGGPATVSHIHCCAPPGSNAAVLFPFTGVPNVTSGSIPEQTFAITPAQVAQLEAGMIFQRPRCRVSGRGDSRQILPAATPEPEAWDFWRLGCY
jgi:hypothetical protein